MELENLLDGLMQEVRKVVTTTTMIGQPLKVGTTHMVPLVKLSIGFGTALSQANGTTAGRDGKLEAGGAGGSISVEPRAFVIAGGDGLPHLVSLRRGKHGVLQKALELRQRPERPAVEAGKPSEE